VANIAGTRHEPTSVLAERALALLRHRGEGQAAAGVDTVLTDADGGDRAAAGSEATMDAVNRGTVDRLYLVVSYREDGRGCPACQAVQRAKDVTCRWCGATTSALELGEAMVQRVLAAGGDVASLDAHAGLERAGGIAARLRYPTR
jgi:hypothetical protein